VCGHRCWSRWARQVGEAEGLWGLAGRPVVWAGQLGRRVVCGGASMSVLWVQASRVVVRCSRLWGLYGRSVMRRGLHRACAHVDNT
jgi:hypothetical protein